MTTKNSPSARAIALAFALDLALVIVFAAVGRASHDSNPIGLGLFVTAWPFVAALVIAWLVSGALRRPTALWPHGVVVWLVTVAGGLGVRVWSGDTAALPFVIVTTLTLALFLLGWRVIATLVLRQRGRKAQ